MQNSNVLIRTKFHLPSIRSSLVHRPGLQESILLGLRGRLTLVIAPAGFGKTTLTASSIAHCGMPVAWLSLDKNDNQLERFFNYLVSALQEVDNTLGRDAAQLLTGMQKVQPEAVLTCLINDLDKASGEIVLVLDDYQFIQSQEVHEQIAFLLENCPKNFHLVIATRSDPPLPLARLRARWQIVELRTADLSFSKLEATQFLNEIMGLRLDAQSIAMLEERTEGWIAGLQMAALSIQNRQDVPGFLEAFSGTNRFILDYLLEEVLAGQSSEIQHFLLCTSILERLTTPLCDAVLVDNQVPNMERQASANLGVLSPQGSVSILEYLERANLFLVPLDEERTWYRYHHLFADLLRTRLHQAVGEQQVAQYHLRASAWYEQYGYTVEAIHHASLASDLERVERLIEQNYIEMMNRGEMSEIRSWMGELNKELVYRRPWLCLYEAYSRAWFGQLDEAVFLLKMAERHLQSEIRTPDLQVMGAYYSYVLSRVTAMQGDLHQAIELCLAARKNIPADNLGLQIEVSITLGYQYFLRGDFENASKTLYEMIRTCQLVNAINNPVAGYALLARIHISQGLLHNAYDLFQKAAHLLQETGRKYLGAVGLVEVGIADLFYEWNDVESALVHVKKGLDLLPYWGKTDDVCLAYATLARIQLAQGGTAGAAATVDKAAQLIHTAGVFSEARAAIDAAQVHQWLLKGDKPAVNRWLAIQKQDLGPHDPYRYEDELTRITLARVFIAQSKYEEAIALLTCLEEGAGSGGRQGRLLEILILKALAMQGLGETTQAEMLLTGCLTLAEPGGYTRIFLDEGRPMQFLLARWLAHAEPSSLQDYAVQLLAQFIAEPHGLTEAQEKISPVTNLIEPLSQRELEVLRLMALGKTNPEIARQLVVAPGTVKAHAASIYRKLDAANRTEAVARARQVGIFL
jgi:LuxR family transcriptional regulator, maltose regulon positive regulatory protein